jgi:endonuclease YncB( thermonuclease family)
LPATTVTIPNKKNPRGLVEVKGTIMLNQFYYRGGLSDADTVKIELTVDSVRFKKNKNTNWQDATDSFFEGHVNGRPVIDSQNRLTIRLQGIDAPELHYTAKRGIPEKDMTPLQKANWKNCDFRQLYSARATFELAKKLSQYEASQGAGFVEAKAVSRVDKPGDVFDVYGRFVGNILVSKDSSLDINEWLVQKGWALPGFYESMTAEEINSLLHASSMARAEKRGVWKHYSSTIIEFDLGLCLPDRGEEPVDPFTDKGDILMPKLFRRQVQFEVNKRAGIFHDQDLKEYLANLKSKDYYYERCGYFEKGSKAKKHSLDQVISANGNKVNKMPFDLIFIEKASTLKDYEGRKITTWY